MAWAEKEANREAVSNLFIETATYKRGDTVPWDVIERTIGRGRRDGWAAYIIKRWRGRMLAERGIAMRPSIGVGYRLLENSAQVDECSEDRRRRMSRQAYRAIGEVGAADTTGLGEFYQARQAAQLRALTEERAKILGGLQSLLRKSETPLS